MFLGLAFLLLFISFFVPVILSIPLIFFSGFLFNSFLLTRKSKTKKPRE